MKRRGPRTDPWRMSRVSSWGFVLLNSNEVLSVSEVGYKTSEGGTSNANSREGKYIIKTSEIRSRRRRILRALELETTKRSLLTFR